MYLIDLLIVVHFVFFYTRDCPWMSLWKITIFKSSRGWQTPLLNGWSMQDRYQEYWVTGLKCTCYLCFVHVLMLEFISHSQCSIAGRRRSWSTWVGWCLPIDCRRWKIACGFQQGARGNLAIFYLKNHLWYMLYSHLSPDVLQTYASIKLTYLIL